MEAYERFEQEWGEWAEVENVVACSSGTAALHLAMEVLEGPGSSMTRNAKVVVPDFAMIACPRAVTMAGLVPVFADCHKDLLIDVGSVNVWKGVRSIMPVHIYGRRCEMDKVHEIADELNLSVVEDLAEAHGIKPHAKTDAACWSFYKNKIVAGEEGGAVAFKDKPRAKEARCLRSLGFTDAHDFTHVPRGHNYRLANALANLISSNLQWTKHRLKARRGYEAEYELLCPPEWKMPKRETPWVYDIRIPGLTSEKQGQVVKALQEVGVAARHGFKPCSHQPEYVSGNAAVTKISEALIASREVIYLPLTYQREGQGNVAFATIHRILSQP